MERNRDDVDDGMGVIKFKTTFIKEWLWIRVACGRGVMLGKGSFSSVYLVALKNPARDVVRKASLGDGRRNEQWQCSEEDR